MALCQPHEIHDREEEIPEFLFETGDLFVGEGLTDLSEFLLDLFERSRRVVPIEPDPGDPVLDTVGFVEGI